MGKTLLVQMKIYYNPHLKELARQLRNNSTQSEIRLWKYLKGKQIMGYDFHRQKPIDNVIAVIQAYIEEFENQSNE